MSIDKELSKKAFKESAKKTMALFNMMEHVCGRCDLYRVLFDYPKKWSKRKVKKKGSYDIQLLRLDYGLSKAVEAISALGPEYAESFIKEPEIKEMECNYCDGDGRVMYAHCAGGMHTESYRECEECCGSGYIEEDNESV